MSAGAAQMTQCGVASNLGEPGTQPLGLAQFVDLAPGRNKRFLTGVLAGGEIAQNTQGDPADHCLVTRHDFDKCALVTRAGGACQIGVSGRGDIKFGRQIRCMLVFAPPKHTSTFYKVDATSGQGVTGIFSGPATLTQTGMLATDERI